MDGSEGMSTVCLFYRPPGTMGFGLFSFFHGVEMGGLTLV